jgi:hypothetical protein
MMPGMGTITISCDDCIMQGTDACHECVVTFICDRDPDDAIIIDAGEERALRLLGRSGLTPPLRHHRSQVHGALRITC